MDSVGAAPRAGVPFHSARAEASWRNGALGPGCTEAMPQRGVPEPVFDPAPRRWRGRRHGQGQTNPRFAGIRANPSRTRRRTNLGCIGPDRTRPGRKPSRGARPGIRTNPSRFERCPIRTPRSPNQPEAGRAFINPRCSERRVPLARFPAVRPRTMIQRKS
jgi:hypothetical protein